MEIEFVTADELEYCESLFLPEAAQMIAQGEPLTALAVAKEDEDMAVGAIAGYLDDGFFHIISLYVAPDYRRQGAGRMLIDSIREAGEDDLVAMQIDFTVTQKEHETLAPFLEAVGFTNDTDNERNIFLFSIDDMDVSEFFSKGKEKGTMFLDVSSPLLKQANELARINGAERPENGFTGDDVEKGFSVALLKENKILAYVVFDHSCAEKLTWAATWVDKTEESALPGMLRTAFHQVKEANLEDTILATQTLEPEQTALLKALFPSAKPISFTYLAMF